MDLAGGIAFVLIAAGLATVIGLAFGIVIVAPRIGRALDRAETDEEPVDRPD